MSGAEMPQCFINNWRRCMLGGGEGVGSPKTDTQPGVDSSPAEEDIVSPMLTVS